MKNSNLKEINRPLNNAIAYVICAKFKKDAINAFEAVTAAGYKIEKQNGAFVVFNPKTSRYIYISASRNYIRYDNLVLDSEYNYYAIRVNDPKYVDKYGVGVLSLFDFVGYLETPTRKYTLIKRQRAAAAELSITREKWHHLRSAARDIIYEVNRIAEIQNKIAQLQKELVMHADFKAREEIRYNEMRKKYGLKAKM